MAAFGRTPDVHAIRLDVSDRTAFARAADETERVFGKVHLVCNNAGVIVFLPIEECTYNEWDWIMGVNFFGVVNGCHTFIPRIRRHGEGGHIVNTASIGAYLPAGRAGIYTAAKFGVLGLSEALRLSLYRYNIGVSVFCPGMIKSAIYESEKVRPQALASEKVAISQQVMEKMGDVYQWGMEPVEVGEKVMAGIRRNDMHIFSHPEFKDELREVFDETLAEMPEGEAPPQRLAFENGRREGLRRDKTAARRIGG
jgi:NAD(P)-dependent dehydrogenase (short-subunit alcohol dehydrogenase family)